MGEEQPISAPSKTEDVLNGIRQIGVPPEPPRPGAATEPPLTPQEDVVQSVAASLGRTLSRAVAFYFKYPVKLFRPSVIETLHLAKTRAAGPSEVPLVPSSLRAISHGVKVDGLKQFSANVLPAFTLNVLLGAAMFATYDLSKDFFLRHPQYHPWDDGFAQTAFTAFVAGSLAGVTQAAFAAPLDVVNIQIWLKRHTGQRLTIHHELWTLVRAHGVRHLYQQLPVTLLRDCVGLGLFFMTFETMKRATVTSQPQFFLQNSMAVVFSGAIAGLAHQIVFHPTDTLKRALVSEEARSINRAHGAALPRRSLWQQFHDLVIKRHGLRFLFRGYLNSTTKAMPPAAVAFLIYEATSKEFENREK